MVDIPDGYLVQDADGTFSPPESVTQVMTYSQDVSSTFTPFVDGATPVGINTPQSFVYGVCNTEEVPDVEFPDTSIPVIIDPTDGTCICFVNCPGNEISYVKVVAIAF
jgi:hypothetical protein